MENLGYRLIKDSIFDMHFKLQASFPVEAGNFELAILTVVNGDIGTGHAKCRVAGGQG